MDLKAAAKEVARSLRAEIDRPGGVSRRYAEEIAEKALRRVLTPDDDQESVTQEWVEAVSGGRWKHDLGGDWLKLKASVWLKGDGMGVECGKFTCPLSDLTRGEFRRLCAAVGIDLLPSERCSEGEVPADDKEHEANARLIACAPDMYSLITDLSCLCNIGDADYLVGSAKELLARLHGEQAVNQHKEPT